MAKKIPIDEHLQIVEAQTQALAEIKGEVAIEEANLLERIESLELALEDVGWLRMGMEGEREFSRSGLRLIHQLARVFYLKNPLIGRGVDVQKYYVFGQGMSISGDTDELNDIIQRFTKDPKNQAELTSHQALLEKEVDLQIASNIFFCFFTHEVSGRVRVRTIPFDDVTDIITNPEDRKENWFYKRVWTEQIMNPSTGNPTMRTREAYYPDWRYNPEASGRLDYIGKVPVFWDSPVYHVKTGGLSGMQFGVPEVYPALDWARAYKEFLENWSTIVKAYARFAWQMTHKGGAAGVAAAKAKLGTGLTTGGAGTDTNPPPVTASTFISTEGVSMSPFRTAGATTAAEDGRRLLLMVASVMGLPETFFGDVSVGTLATANSLDRPTELKMVSRQTFWADIFRDIIEYVAFRAIEAGKLAGQVIDDDGVQVIQVTNAEGKVTSLDALINVEFPPILEHNITATVDAIVKAATLGGTIPAGTIPDMVELARMLLSALGADDVDGMVDKLFPKGEAEEQTPAEKGMVEAIAELRESLRELASAD